MYHQLLIPLRFIVFSNIEFGVIGYALAQTIPWILWAFLNRYYSNKIFGIRCQKKILLHLPIAVLSLFITFLLQYLFLRNFLQNSIILIIVTSFVELLIFIGFLILFKELKRSDLKFFLQIVKFRKYKESLKDEFANQNT